MERPKIAAITGSNKGLGLSLVRSLCREWGQEGRIYLMARDEARGLAAQRQLEHEGLHPLFCRLDLTGLLPAGTTHPYGQLVQYRRVLPWS